MCCTVCGRILKFDLKCFRSFRTIRYSCAVTLSRTSALFPRRVNKIVGDDDGAVQFLTENLINSVKQDV